jgi:hypothetical protein
MSRAKWRFTPSEVSRAIRIAREAGLDVTALEITTDGRIRIATSEPIARRTKPKPTENTKVAIDA